ncbi:hypothetical protein PENNAL_c0095G11909, partial [Penicillium nalgiovense]
MVRPARQRLPRKPLTIAQAWDKVESAAYSLGTGEYLGKKDSNRVSKAFFLLNHPPQSTSHRKYRLFLLRVNEKCGPQGVRLCAVALGHDHIRDMSNGHRDALLCKLGEMKHQPLIKNLSFPSGDTQVDGPLNEQLTKETQIIRSDDHESSPCSNSSRTTTPRPLLINNAEADRSIASIGESVNSESGCPLDDDYHIMENREIARIYPSVPDCYADQYFTTVSRLPQNDGQDDITNTQEIFEHASLAGIATVFSGLICGAIRTTLFQANGEKYSKASVTTVFPPWGGPVDCLLSLEVCESWVQPLAMALFSATVKWVGKTLHVGFERGTTLTVPNSEATLKGVENEAIAMVFGSEIQLAIKESRIRLRELEEGKLATECVSMIVTGKGAIVNLSLGL